MAGEAEAREAIYAAVVAVIQEAAEYEPHARAQIIKDVAVAYRLARGGAQPGSSIVEKA